MAKQNEPTHIVLHHSLTKDGDTVSWSAIRRWHMGLHPESPKKIRDEIKTVLDGEHHSVRPAVTSYKELAATMWWATLEALYGKVDVGRED